ncbi:unnamed protein product [Prunus brigantina]
MRNLEIKKLIYDKRDALAAQYAAEATLGTTMNLLLLILHSLLAFLLIAVLLQAERILRSALERALIVGGSKTTTSN